MSILVTGGAGFIGSHTCIELLKAGFDVVVVDNFYNSKREALRRIAELSKKEFAFYECDIRDEEGLDKVFKSEKIDAVIHFAGLKSVPESCKKPLEYYDNNIGGTLTLCRVMKKNGCQRIVFSSSATVYGMNNPSPLKETMPTGGTTNPYGTTKYMIELILKDLYTADNQWSISLLRYFNPIGAHEFQTTLCRISLRSQSESANISMFSATIMTLRTEPACAIISTLLTLPSAMSRLLTAFFLREAARCLTSEPALVTAFLTLFTLLKRRAESQSIIKSARAARVILQPAIPTRQRRRISSAGKRKGILSRCAPIHGVGRA